MTLTVYLPVKTTNPTNGSHRHWSVRARERKRQRSTAHAMVGDALTPRTKARWQVQAEVTLTRVSPGILDDDNLRPALKSIRDGVADALGYADDRDPRLTWHYAQRRGKRGEYMVEVEIA